MAIRNMKEGINRNGVYFRNSSVPIVWSIGVYIRLSVADGNDVSLSVKNQDAIIRHFLEKEFNEPHHVHKIYIDDGISGTTNDERDAFQELIQDIEDGKVNCVVSKMLSRVFRNYSDQGYFLEEYFPRMGIRFITLEAPKVDTFADPNVVHGYELPLNGIVNDRIAEASSRAVRQTFRNMRREGKFQGGFAPYGYIRDPEDKYHFVVDEEAAAVVKQIFTWYVNDRMGLETIRKKLNALRVPNPTGYKILHGMKYRNPGVTNESHYAWTGRTVKQTLQNRVYLGDMVQGKCTVISYKVHKQIGVPQDQWDVVPGKHEPIIDQEIFDRAQELLSLNKTMKYYGKSPSLLAGFLYCADCREKMHKRKSDQREYYACSTYYKRNKDDCTSHFIRKELIEGAVLEAIRRQIALVDVEELLSGISVERKAAYRSQKEKLIQSKEKEIQNLNQQIENLYLDYNKRIIDESQYLKLKEKFSKMKEELAQAILSLHQELNDEGACRSEFSKWLEVFRKHQNITELDRQVLEEMVERIYVDQQKNITIHFKYGDLLERI